MAVLTSLRGLIAVRIPANLLGRKPAATDQLSSEERPAQLCAAEAAPASKQASDMPILGEDDWASLAQALSKAGASPSALQGLAAITRPRRVKTPRMETVGVFPTPQSFVSFPAVSGALILVWRVFSAVFPTWGTSKLVPFVGAFVLGTFVYYISLPERSTRRVRVVAAGIGLINSFFLAASALGVRSL